MTIICIIGPSGSGKTTLAEALVPTGIDTIRSYTTRPMRPGEKNGREHIFIDEQDAIRLLSTRRPLAYTLFGGYHYFALWEQVGLSPMSVDSVTALPSISRGSTEDTPSHPTTLTPSQGSAAAALTPSHLLTYVIDEAGYHSLLAQILDLQNEMHERYHVTLPPIHLLPIRIERSEADLSATIDPARRRRDDDRHAYDDTIPYRIVIHNDAPSAYQLTAWAQTQLSTALPIWLSSNTESQHPVSIPTTLTTEMPTAQIIAHLNGAI